MLAFKVGWGGRAIRFDCTGANVGWDNVWDELVRFGCGDGLAQEPTRTNMSENADYKKGPQGNLIAHALMPVETTSGTNLQQEPTRINMSANTDCKKGPRGHCRSHIQYKRHRCAIYHSWNTKAGWGVVQAKRSGPLPSLRNVRKSCRPPHLSHTLSTPPSKRYTITRSLTERMTATDVISGGDSAIHQPEIQN